MNQVLYTTVLPIAAMFIIMYFLTIRPENKRKEQVEEMRENLKKGDVITTIGGIVGKVASVTASTVVIETSDDRVRMELARWAVSTVGAPTADTTSGGKKRKKNKKKAEAAEEVADTDAQPIERLKG